MLLIGEVRYRRRHHRAPLTEDCIMKLVREMSSKVRIHFRAHDLRRTLGNRLCRRGVDLETIAKILRHEGSTTTLRAYIGVTRTP